MLLKASSDVNPQVVKEGVSIRWLMSADTGAPHFAMRIIEIQPGIVFEPHLHPYEHEIYVLEGSGVVTNRDGDVGDMLSGRFLYIPADEFHGYRNTGDIPLKFICVIPL